jgi:hypothetical protein
MSLSLIERAGRYVSAMPAAISGSGGSVACLAVANALKHGFALSREEAWPILIEYSERCTPPWSERELEHKWESAGRSHPTPLGYLRGSSAPTPTKPPKPIRTPRFNWRAVAAEATARVAQAAAPKPTTPTTPAAEVSSWRSLIEAAARMFNATVIPDEAEEADDDDLRERLAAIGAILDQRDDKDRAAYTRSQVESCRIGLARYGGTSKAADDMLTRLAAAQKSALSWQTMAARWGRK